MPRDHSSPDEAPASDRMEPLPVVSESKTSDHEPRPFVGSQHGRCLHRSMQTLGCQTVRVQGDSASDANAAESGVAAHEGLSRSDEFRRTVLDSTNAVPAGDAASAEREVIPPDSREALLKQKICNHLREIGLRKSNDGRLEADFADKDRIRKIHSWQRHDRLSDCERFISQRVPKLLKYFASGHEVDPEAIVPSLERVIAGTWKADLFRLASLTWSIPVSNGFGRRLRYLVWDERNDKLIGLIAIGDPVFNLSVRDKLVGWDAKDRAARLVNTMDAYVLGALPPYNALLGGKMVACLVRSREIYNDFSRAYGATTGIISGKEKRARLLAVTTSSSLGRSSVYNRLHLGGQRYFQPIGYTQGWGHFHIPDSLFRELRDYLRDIGHRYADAYRFGQGPSWRLRATRAALLELGFRGDLLRHGIRREVFWCGFADNATMILRTGNGSPDLSSLLNARQIAELAIERWVAPRSKRRPSFRSWTTEDLQRLLASGQQNRADAAVFDCSLGRMDR